jgi:NitT/TauT family transport system substrate-binding protein
MSRKLFPIAMLALSLGILSATPQSKAENLTPFTALIPIPNVDESFAPVAVAKYLGFFQKEGLDVNLIPVKGSNEVAIQVSAGNADVGLASPADAIIGMQPDKGLNVQYYYNIYYRSIWPVSVPSASPIQSISDLKGKKLGVLSMGSTGISFGRAYAKDAGLDPEKDITFVPIGAGAQALIAIKQGLVDGMVFNDSALAKFSVAGLKTRLLPVGAKLRDLPDTSILANRNALKNKRAQLIGFARALAMGYHFTVENPAAAVKITWKLYPEAEPKNMPPADALAQGIAVCKARMAIWSSPKANDVDGNFVEGDWSNLVGFLNDAGLLTQPVPADHIYTTVLLPEINKFDRAAVVEQAKTFNPDALN